MSRPNHNHNHEQVTGLILAGGAGRRVGGRDKGLVEYRGHPLIYHANTRLRDQVASMLICCNRNTEDYQTYTPNLVHDKRSNYQGPLAGFEAAINHVHTPFLLVVPCDCPSLPLDLAVRLISPLVQNKNLDMCYAHDGQRPQFLFVALRTECLVSLPAFLDAGHRAVSHWMEQHRLHEVDFSDCQENFLNVNKLPDSP